MAVAIYFVALSDTVIPMWPQRIAYILILVVVATTLLLMTTEYTAPQSTTQVLQTTSTTTSPMDVASSTEHSTTTSRSTPKMPILKSATTTVFWIGEPSDASNGYIPNDVSAWDDAWQQHYGGYDDPDHRCGYVPCSFTPQENPFYFALPYNDLDAEGVTKSSAHVIVPWWTSENPPRSQLKNKWIAVTYKSRTCYGQWQDVGPYEEDDSAYVFGNSPPANAFGLRAGLDVSPALNDCLHLGGSGVTGWRFIEEQDVPPGPWKDTVTTRDVHWN